MAALLNGDLEPEVRLLLDRLNLVTGGQP